MSLKISPLPTRAKNIECPPLMKEIGLEHPFSLVYGGTGSGKSVSVLNILTLPQMYGNYFDQVFLFSVTGNSDDSFDVLDLDKKNIVTTDMIQRLKKILQKQKAAVERRGIDKAPKVCIIFEDLTANKKLMNSPDFLRSFVQNRHASLSVLACCHKMNALVRTARLNSNHHFIFPCSESEVSRITEQHQPPELKKHEFEGLIRYAFTPSDDNTHPFLWINTKQPTKTLFRRSLDQILELN